MTLNYAYAPLPPSLPVQRVSLLNSLEVLKQLWDSPYPSAATLMPAVVHSIGGYSSQMEMIHTPRWKVTLPQLSTEHPSRQMMQEITVARFLFKTLMG